MAVLSEQLGIVKPEAASWFLIHKNQAIPLSLQWVGFLLLATKKKIPINTE